ncbi:MAG: hypothetical protein ACIAQF_11940 [Phycisphaerales bacterium JB065]
MPWLRSIAVISGPAVFLLGVFAPLILALLIANWLGRLVDPLQGGRSPATPYTDSDQSSDTDRVFHALRTSIREQNSDVVTDMAASAGLGVVIATIVFGLIYWIFGYLVNGLQSLGISAPNWLPMVLTGASMLICATAALYGYEPDQNLPTGHTLDRPYVPSQRHLDQGFALEAMFATLLVEPFRLIAKGIVLCKEIRLEDHETLKSAANIVTSQSPDANTLVPVSAKVAGLLLRCRLLKAKPGGTGVTTFILTEKYKELLGQPSVGSDGLSFQIPSVNDGSDRVSSEHERHPRRQDPEWKRY